MNNVSYRQSASRLLGKPRQSSVCCKPGREWEKLVKNVKGYYNPLATFLK